MTCLKWAFFACFACSSLGIQTLSQSCDPSDLLALKEFAGNLKNGSIITSWSNNNSVCCQWDGVVCGNEGNNDSVASRVSMLILPKKGQKGIIWRSLGRLDCEECLTVSLRNIIEQWIQLSITRQDNNRPSQACKVKIHFGELIISFFEHFYKHLCNCVHNLYMDKLKLLDLSCNHFEGVLPVDLSNLKQFQVLDLSHNLLSGQVSRVLSGLKMIQSLNVSSNSFTGDLLDLGGFPNLAVFNMNHFVGSLELEGLENCSSSFKELHLDVNSFSGHLPDYLYSFSSLQQLSLSENYFSGQD
ncbi:hypothetical protein Ddye_025638 [Dipteronia dyeriana]|uniref:Leucine-rich repeat-containing N-terminal plant-type domain-containing protein n=1 Tax=Dipteronia dyeriana TaxID=168575 RepID=A0AAD9TL64_9ROSI|nr:hypothetical protein Ddye_025638 [Dipteronia dyeriana]